MKKLITGDARGYSPGVVMPIPLIKRANQNTTQKVYIYPRITCPLHVTGASNKNGTCFSQVYLFSALRSFIFFYRLMTAPIGTIPLPFRIYKEPEDAHEELWNPEMPHVYVVNYASTPDVRNAILQKRCCLVCAAQKAARQRNDSLVCLRQDITCSL